MNWAVIYYTPATKLGGVYWIQPVCLSVCLCVCPLTFRVRPVASTVPDGFFPYLVQMITSKVCRMWWPLTLTYIVMVIWPWLRKLCPLCSVYSSKWIPFMFGTNDHYHEGECHVLRFFQKLEIWIFGKFFKFFGLDLEKKFLQFSMDSFHIYHKWSLVSEGVLHIMTFDLDLYLQGHLALALKIVFAL